VAGSDARSSGSREVVGGAGLTWDELATIRSWSSLPLVVKGILTAEDASLAVDHGADAVWVSNHGGRQLDRVPTAPDVLESVVEAVGGRAEVYLDGGVRRGTDVVTALGLGATAVFLGRPILYALACAGEAGVAHALGILREETELALALLGATDPASVTRAHVGRAPR
jgi:isopentenyl diphosphate isomerase/L-lactate dehydrogenase-like FMN-dependent dehydrogenase